MNHLNIFNPFKNKSNYHEDELTRSFLILIKNVSVVQICFIEMVREEMSRQNCFQVIPSLFDKNSSVESIETQITQNNELFKIANGRRLVSVIISDDKLFKDTTVEKSNRNARYDGVILYQPNWILVIENKPSVENVWLDQLNPNVSDDIEIEEKPISLSWRKIIENFSSLIERSVVQGFERILIEDFLEYIDDEYTKLNPYTHFALCKDNNYLLTRRCIAIMESSVLGEVKYHRGWKDYIAIDEETIKMIALSPCDDSNEWSIKLEMYPGDTMRQARNLYNNIHKDKLVSLEKNGWTINPNMHFSFQASNLVWTNVQIDIHEYVDYWINNKDSLNQVHRNDFQSFFSRMKNEDMISDNDWEGINNNIINTKMQTINVCPGIGLIYEWPKNGAIDLDKGDRFVDVFKEKVKEAMNSWR